MGNKVIYVYSIIQKDISITKYNCTPLKRIPILPYSLHVTYLSLIFYSMKNSIRKRNIYFIFNP